MLREATLTTDEELLRGIAYGHYSEFPPLDPLSTSAAGYRAQMEARAYDTSLACEGLPDELASYSLAPIVEFPSRAETARIRCRWLRSRRVAPPVLPLPSGATWGEALTFCLNVGLLLWLLSMWATA